MARSRSRLAIAAALVVLLVAGVAVLAAGSYFGPRSITAFFTSATSIYPSDDVRVAGVKVGSIESITPDGSQARVELRVDRDVPIPADARAVIVSQSLIAARYVQLTPAYETSGPTMPDDATIPLERTAVPVEWDEVKEQLTRLATELGPPTEGAGTSLSRFIGSAASAMGDGNADKLRATITQLSGVGRILADGSGDLVGTIRHLQTFITALRDSNTQIVQFQGRLATLSTVLDGSRADLAAALTNVAQVVDEVQRFVSGSRNQTAEQIRRLADVTQNLVEHSKDIEQILHVAPSGLANTYNFFDPRDGAINGVFALNDFSDPLSFLCGSIGALENVTAGESAKLCSQYLGPALNSVRVNGLPFPVNPLLTSVPPDELLKYTEPGLAPGAGGTGPTPPPAPPVVSAYPAAGTAPEGLPQLLLPAEAPAPAAPPDGRPGP